MRKQHRRQKEHFTLARKKLLVLAFIFLAGLFLTQYIQNSLTGKAIYDEQLKLYKLNESNILKSSQQIPQESRITININNQDYTLNLADLGIPGSNATNLSLSLLPFNIYVSPGEYLLTAAILSTDT